MESRVTTVRSADGLRQELSMFRRIPWQDVCNFFGGAFFETSGILFCLRLHRIPMPISDTALEACCRIPFHRQYCSCS